MRTGALTTPGAAALVLNRDADGAQRAKPRGCKARPAIAPGLRPRSADLKREVCVSFCCSAAGRERAAQLVGVHALHLEQLLARRLATHYRHAARGDAEALCDEPPDRDVRAPVHGRRLHAAEERALPLAGDLVPAGARLDTHGDSAHGGESVGVRSCIPAPSRRAGTLL